MTQKNRSPCQEFRCGAFGLRQCNGRYFIRTWFRLPFDRSMDNPDNPFNFLMVRVSVIIGFAVTEILAVSARLLRARSTSRPYWIHTVLIVGIFLALWWESWGLCPLGQRRPRPFAVSPTGPCAFGAHPRWSEARGPTGPQASTRLDGAPKSLWLYEAGFLGQHTRSDRERLEWLPVFD